MSLKIVRNDITKMATEAIVNTACEFCVVGEGCDSAVYEAAGYNELLAYRKANVGSVSEGEAFITPGFGLLAKYIIHAVSPLYIDGSDGEDEKLRLCYRNSLRLAKEHGIASIAFPLISTGSFGYPKEEGMRIAIDEINGFLLENSMDIFLVVFDEQSTEIGQQLHPELETYINRNYVLEKTRLEYVEPAVRTPSISGASQRKGFGQFFRRDNRAKSSSESVGANAAVPMPAPCLASMEFAADEEASIQALNDKLAERISHKADTFSMYLLYLIQQKGMENADVYKRAIVDKKTFSKIKNNPDYHPQKITALCLCVGAMLNLDETKDLLARAGYALSPSDLTDIIFSFYIEQGHYDIIDIDIQLEEHGLPCIIS